jgi:hypothetical protein
MAGKAWDQREGLGAGFGAPLGDWRTARTRESKRWKGVLPCVGGDDFFMPPVYTLA